MPRKVRINVTKKDIKDWTDRYNKGSVQALNPDNCAINKAIRRKVPSARLGYGTVYFDDGAKHNFTNMLHLKPKIDLLDRGIIIPPFTFTLEVPDGF